MSPFFSQMCWECMFLSAVPSICEVSDAPLLSSAASDLCMVGTLYATAVPPHIMHGAVLQVQAVLGSRGAS